MMKTNRTFALVFCAARVLLLLLIASATAADSYKPSNWVNDPFCVNTNFGTIGADSPSPIFTNNAIQRGTLYINSPIGAPLTLTKPGDTITFTGQVKLAGDINPDGDMQFRAGIYYRGRNPSDTNWLGYTFGNPAGNGGGAATGLYIRNNPNRGVYASGSSASATRPDCVLGKYNSGWVAGTYDFSLSVSLAASNAHQIAWSLTGVSPNAFAYSASYKNTNAQTAPLTFDQVGFMGGAALFNSASTDNRLIFTNLVVNLSN